MSQSEEAAPVTYGIVGKIRAACAPWAGEKLDSENGAMPWRDIQRAIQIPWGDIDTQMRKAFDSPALEDSFDEFADFFLLQLFKLCKNGSAPERLFTSSFREVEKLVNGFINFKTHGHPWGQKAIDRLGAGDHTEDRFLARLHKGRNIDSDYERADKDFAAFIAARDRIKRKKHELLPFEQVYLEHRDIIITSFGWHYLAVGLNELLKAAKQQQIRMQSMLSISKQIVTRTKKQNENPLS
jgi:hypothetical protein